MVAAVALANVSLSGGAARAPCPKNARAPNTRARTANSLTTVFMGLTPLLFDQRNRPAPAERMNTLLAPLAPGSGQEKRSTLASTSHRYAPFRRRRARSVIIRQLRAHSMAYGSAHVKGVYSFTTCETDQVGTSSGWRSRRYSCGVCPDKA